MSPIAEKISIGEAGEIRRWAMTKSNIPDIADQVNIAEQGKDRLLAIFIVDEEPLVIFNDGPENRSLACSEKHALEIKDAGINVKFSKPQKVAAIPINNNESSADTRGHA